MTLALKELKEHTAQLVHSAVLWLFHFFLPPLYKFDLGFFSKYFRTAKIRAEQTSPVNALLKQTMYINS